MVAGSEEVFEIAAANYRVDGPAALVFAGSWIWIGTGIPKGRRWKLSAVHGAWDYRDDGSVLVDFLGYRTVVRPAIRIFEGDLGGARAAPGGDGRARVRRRNYGHHSGTAGDVRHTAGGISSGQPGEGAPGGPLFGADRDRFFGHGDGHRVEHAGHAGASVGDELSNAADFPSVWRVVPGAGFAEGADRGHRMRSLVLRRRRIADGVAGSGIGANAVWCRFGSGGARCRRRDFAGPGSVEIFED